MLELHGFRYVDGETGIGSGGEYARGAFVRGDRRLEFSVRESLGQVVYYAAGTVVAHEFYMRGKLGRHAPNEYPGSSNDPIEEFRYLARDLEHYCAEFLTGSDSEFLAVAARAEAAKLETALRCSPSRDAALTPHNRAVDMLQGL